MVREIKPFPFIKYAKIFLIFSGALMIFSIYVLFNGHLNMGIDFTGGAQIIVRFQDPLDIEKMRKLFKEKGLEVWLQQFGDEGSRDILIRIPLKKGQEEASAIAKDVENILADHFGSGEGIDINRASKEVIADFLYSGDPLDLKEADPDAAREHYGSIADKIVNSRKDIGVFKNWDQLGLSDNKVVEFLKERAHLGQFAVISVEGVGSTIGAELRRKGVLSVIFALIAMLLYITFRFEFRYAVGAIAALVHDVTVALGMFAFLGYEFNLSTIAAFLTLVGYSINDTVVVFDRVRENLTRIARKSFEYILDLSITQTIKRSILTSFTTLLAVGSLLFLGGPVLRGFSFVLFMGILVGTYSSIVIASPITLAWEKYKERKKGEK